MSTVRCRRANATCAADAQSFPFLSLRSPSFDTALSQLERLICWKYVDSFVRSAHISRLIIINQLILLVFYAEFEDVKVQLAPSAWTQYYALCTHIAYFNVNEKSKRRMLVPWQRPMMISDAVQTSAVIIFNPFQSKECQLGTLVCFFILFALPFSLSLSSSGRVVLIDCSHMNSLLFQCTK